MPSVWNTYSINTADRNLPVDEDLQINGRSHKAESCPAKRIMVQDLERAEVEILKLVQTNTFDKEVKTLKEFQAQTEAVSKDSQSVKERKALLKKTSSLKALDPYLDVIGVLRVGGRITKAKLAESIKSDTTTKKIILVFFGFQNYVN